MEKKIEQLLKEVHSLVKGRLKDWKEEKHLADELLESLIKMRLEAQPFYSRSINMVNSKGEEIG